MARWLVCDETRTPVALNWNAWVSRGHVFKVNDVEMTKLAALMAIWAWIWWALARGRKPLYLALLSVSSFPSSLPLLLINMPRLPAKRRSEMQMINPRQKRTDYLGWQLSVNGINIVWISETIDSFSFSSSRLSPSTFASPFSSRPGGMERDISSRFPSVVYSLCSSPKGLLSPVNHCTFPDL